MGGELACILNLSSSRISPPMAEPSAQTTCARRGRHAVPGSLLLLCCVASLSIPFAAAADAGSRQQHNVTLVPTNVTVKAAPVEPNYPLIVIFKVRKGSSLERRGVKWKGWGPCLRSSRRLCDALLCTHPASGPPQRAFFTTAALCANAVSPPLPHHHH